MEQLSEIKLGHDSVSFHWTLPQESRLLTLYPPWSSIVSSYPYTSDEDDLSSHLVWAAASGVPYSSEWAITEDYEEPLCPIIFQGDYNGLDIHPSVYLSNHSRVCHYPLDGGEKQCADLKWGDHPNILDSFGGRPGYLTLSNGGGNASVQGWCTLFGPQGYQWTLDDQEYYQSRDYHLVYAGVIGHLIMTIGPGWRNGAVRITQWGGSGSLYSEVHLTLPLEKPQFLFFDAPEWDPGFILLEEDSSNDYYGSSPYMLTEFRPSQGDFQTLTPIKIERVKLGHDRPVSIP
jgi:hypothetical protein